MDKRISVTKIRDFVEDLCDKFDEELYNKSEAELEEYWHFKYDTTRSVASNLYKFHSSLKLYGSFCRRWEEHHNGPVCVVERVRDKYLMPKIKKFVVCSKGLE